VRSENGGERSESKNGPFRAVKKGSSKSFLAPQARAQREARSDKKGAQRT